MPESQGPARARPEARRPAAVEAFDASAAVFDARFGDWASVVAQRQAVRRMLLDTFPPGARLLELGGGTGEDAVFLAAHERRVLLTDGAPRIDRKSTRLNSSHVKISYAVFCLKKKKKKQNARIREGVTAT